MALLERLADIADAWCGGRARPPAGRPRRRRSRRPRWRRRPGARLPCPGVAPAVRGESSLTVVKSAGAPTASPRSSQPSERMPAVVAARSSSAGGCKPAAAGDQTLVELERPQLFEQVDHGVHVAADGQRRAGGGQGARRADAVRPGRARSWGTGRSWCRTIPAARCRPRSDASHAPPWCSGPARRPAPAARSGSSPWRRCTPRSHAAARRRARAAGRSAAGPSRRRSRIDAGSTALTLWMAAAIRAVDDSLSASTLVRPGLGVAVREAQLRMPRGRLHQRRLQVARIDQGDSQAGVRRRGEQRLAHRVRILVAATTTVVVEVVELADGGDAGQRHLRVGRPGERVVPLGVELVYQLIHQPAPRPEVGRRRSGYGRATPGAGHGSGRSRGRGW